MPDLHLAPIQQQFLPSLQQILQQHQLVFHGCFLYGVEMERNDK